MGGFEPPCCTSVKITSTIIFNFLYYFFDSKLTKYLKTPSFDHHPNLKVKKWVLPKSALSSYHRCRKDNGKQQLSRDCVIVVICVYFGLVFNDVPCRIAVIISGCQSMPFIPMLYNYIKRN